MKTTQPSGAMTRADLLKAGGVLLVSFSLAGSLAPDQAQAAIATAAGGPKPVTLDRVESFLAVGADGGVTVYSGKVDLGTGVRTAITQIAAEELYVPLARVNVIQGDTDLTPDQGTSSGSLSIQIGGMQIRQAAATARAALLASAAQRLGVPAGDLTLTDGVFSDKSGTKRATYAELIGGSSFALNLDKSAPLKPASAYTLVGKPVPRLDIPAKVTGTFTYVQDVKIPGMLHGRVVHPKGDGATLLHLDDSGLKNIKGARVVRRGNFVAVVAPSEWAAIKGAKALKLTWSKWEGLPEQKDLWTHVRSSKIAKEQVTGNVGDVAAALPLAARRLKATYDFAIHTHGSIGPSAAVAQFKDGRLNVWTASQATHALRTQLAEMLSMKEADVRCIYVDGAGCYGRNGHEDAAADAALLARETKRPVRVQWSRADEHGFDPKGPPTLVDLEAGLDASGQVTAWKGQFWMPNGVLGAVALLGAEHANLPAPELEAYRPGNVFQNSDIPYDFPNVHVVCHRLAETPFRPSWIRSPGRMQNTFANEAFLDELVVAMGYDPLQYRLRHVKADPRASEVLERLGKLAAWDARVGSRGHGTIMRGRGLSYVRYDGTRTYVGAVADVEVDANTHRARVTNVAIVHDTGMVVNPDGLKLQIEGNVIQTVSRTLIEELKFDRSRVTSLDWKSYPILKFPDVPKVAIELIDRPTVLPWGGGEPSAAVIPAAVANAIFDATGKRLRSVPITPEKIRAAMASA